MAIHPRAQFWTAAAAIAALLLTPAPAAAQDTPDSLAGEVSAILITSDGPRLLLTETDHGVSSTRLIGIGDEYRDGWRLDAVDGGVATLGKDEAVRSVALGATARSDPAPGGALSIIENLQLTNAVVGGSGEDAPADRARIDSAIARGDLAEVVALGGSAEDEASAASVAVFGPGGQPYGTTALVSYQGEVAMVVGLSPIQLIATDQVRNFPVVRELPDFERIFGPAVGGRNEVVVVEDVFP